MQDIDQALNIKLTVNFVILLFLEYHDFLNIFFRELANILLERRLYNHKI